MLIPIGRVGKILAGEHTGYFVKVVDDSVASGGFLILTSPNPQMQGGFDGWVESETDLLPYFSEVGWKIDWDVSN